MKHLTFDRFWPGFLLLVFALVATGLTRAQTQAWDTNVINWVSPTQCTTGEPISSCPLTGYRLEQSATPTGVFTTLTTITNPATLSFIATGVTAGQHCYRGIALSANGESAPSNVACKTNVRPVGPPNPPVLTVAQAQAFSTLYNKRTKHWRVANQIGVAKLGAECTTYPVLGDGYYAIVNPKANVTLCAGHKFTTYVAARCA